MTLNETPNLLKIAEALYRFGPDVQTLSGEPIAFEAALDRGLPLCRRAIDQARLLFACDLINERNIGLLPTDD